MTPTLEMPRAFFVAASIALALGNSVDAHAVATCVLYTDDASHEDRAAWAAVGFQIEERRELGNYKPEEMARLLDDHHYALFRKASRNVMWLSTTAGLYSPGWLPAALAAPEPGAKPDRRFSCSSLRSHLPYYAASRRSIGELSSLATNGGIGRTVGEAVLDAERYFLVSSGFSKYEQAPAKAIYLAILDEVRALKEAYGDDFPTFWFNVRQLVYSKKRSNIRYCDEYANMTSALVDKCTSCIGETYLMAALFYDSHALPPVGYEFGVQTFNAHIRPVLFNISSRTTMDLVTGGVGPFRSAILRPNSIFRGLWLGQKSMRLASETVRMERVPIDFVYRDWTCIFKTHLVGRHPMQAMDPTGMSGCQDYSPKNFKNPHRADNQNKTDRPSFDETKEPLDLRDGSGEKTDSSAMRPRQAAPESSKVKAFFGGLEDFLGLPARDERLDENARRALESVVANLSADDRKLVLEDLRLGRASPELKELTNQQTFVIAAGLGHLIPSARRGVWNLLPLVNPVLTSSLPASDTAVNLSVGRPNDTQIRKRDGFVLEVLSTDGRFIHDLTSASLPDRFRLLTLMLARDLGSTVDMFVDQKWPAKTIADTLDRGTRESQIKTTLAAVSAGVRKVRSFLYLLNSDSQSNEDGLAWAPLNVATVAIIDRETQVHRLVRPVLSAFAQLKDAPVDLVQTVSRDESAGQIWLGPQGLIESIGNLQMDLRFLYPADRRFRAWRSFENIDFLLANTIFFQLLTHDQLFFTAEPDLDEVMAQRPYYPLEILDPRVRELLRKSDIQAPVPVDLPTWPNFRCPPGVSIFYGSGMAVECGRGSDVVVADRSSDAQNQSGTSGGAPVGVVSSQKNGTAERDQRGLLPEATKGLDQRPGLKRTEDLTPQEMRLRPVAGSSRIVSRGAEGGDASLVDPRQEVHLPPYVWELLIGSVSPRFLIEPPVQILLHHVYRRKLATAFDVQKMNVALRLIPFTALNPPSLALAIINTRNLQLYTLRDPVLPADDRANLERIVRAETKNYDMYEGQADKEFFKIARRELERPKTGFTILSREARLNSGDEALQAYSRSNDVGGIVPFRLKMGPVDYVAFAEPNADGVFRGQARFAVKPRLTLTVNAIWSESGRMIGIIQSTGRSFGHGYTTYHSFESGAEPSGDRRSDRAISEMRAGILWPSLQSIIRFLEHGSTR